MCEPVSACALLAMAAEAMAAIEVAAVATAAAEGAAGGMAYKMACDTYDAGKAAGNNNKSSKEER